MFNYNYNPTQLNIDNSRIKNVTAKLLCAFLLTIVAKAVFKFQLIWMEKKKKLL